MKRTTDFALPTMLCATALLAATALSTHAQGWETYPQGTFYARAMAAHPDGSTAYAANDVFIRRGDAGGTLWSDANMPAVPVGYGLTVVEGKLAVGPSGSVYLPGSVRNLSDGTRTFNLFESSDGAVSWRIVFSVAYASPRPPSEGAIGGLATDAAGNIYVANAHFPGTPGSWSSTLKYFRIRKGVTDPVTGDITWDVVDQYPGTGQLSYSVNSLTVRPKPNAALPAEIWAAGRGNDAKTFKNFFYFVRRSLDGVTWTTANSWPVPSGYSYSSGGIVAGADVNGVTYVSASYEKKAGKTVQNYWLTYRSANQGASWMLVDSFASVSGPSSLAADTLGGVFIAGNGFIRASADGGNTWVSPNLSGANCAASDLLGNVFVGGNSAIYKLPSP